MTGAARGIGRDIALNLAEAGVDVVVTDVLPEIEQTCSEILNRDQKSLAIPTDVRSTEQVEEMVAATVAEFGKVDIMVANAGVEVVKPVSTRLFPVPSGPLRSGRRS